MSDERTEPSALPEDIEGALRGPLLHRFHDDYAAGVAVGNVRILYHTPHATEQAGGSSTLDLQSFRVGGHDVFNKLTRDEVRFVEQLPRVRHDAGDIPDRVVVCPHCGSHNVEDSYPKWFAHSLEECDLENTAILQEWQCREEDCGRSFWVGP